jgi:hypothetical protein
MSISENRFPLFWDMLQVRPSCPPCAGHPDHIGETLPHLIGMAGPSPAMTQV